MDKETRENIEKMAQAQRLADEEQMKAENIAGIIETNEDLDDYEDLIKKLHRKLKTWTGILVTGVIVLIIILLYMIYQIIDKPEPVPEPEPVVIEKEVEQNVTETSLYYKLECPVINKADIKSSTIQGVAQEIAQENVVWSDCYYDETYELNGISLPDLPIGFYKIEPYVDPVLAPNDTVYFLDSVKELMLSQPRTYMTSTEDFDIPDYTELNKSADKGRDLKFGVFDTNFKSGDQETISFYSASLASDVPEDRLADIINPLCFKVVIYDDIDINGVDAAIKEVLLDNTYQKSFDLFTTGDVAETVRGYIGNKLVDKLSSITDKFEITCTSFNYDSIDEQLYSYYDSVTTKDGKIVCTKDGEEVIPETVINLSVTDYEILYDELACAYYFGWY